ncbi:MAG: AAA family ATPase, partial [Pseudobutyrivibrio sp.]|nr:AAA family ATPase [Pseudobutyrivibrio sp.]
KEWWEGGDVVTLITRPRRFGKTLNMSMVDYFFSNAFTDTQPLFENLNIWDYKEYRKLQGQYPTIFLSFASVKGNTYEMTRQQIIQEIVGLYRKNQSLIESDFITDKDKEFWNLVGYDMSDAVASNAVNFICELLYRNNNKKVIILMDEYDTPLQEAYVDGYWNQITSFIRNIFNATFKTNIYLERAIMTGITRVSKESIFSDLNNLKVASITTAKYETAFGFTLAEVDAALQEYGLTDKAKDVQEWYDGFKFGARNEIFNPWSITQFLDTEILDDYWANTSSNMLIDKLIREGSPDIKKLFEGLLVGESVDILIDEEIVFNLIDKNESGVFSMLLASGYLKIVEALEDAGMRKKCRVALTNTEVVHMFKDMVRRWFEGGNTRYNDFIEALLKNDLKYMNRFMNEVALNTFSTFDVGNRPSEYAEPERFYHGFVLGLMVDLADRFQIKSNRESGFGRYDVCLIPKDNSDSAYILEFKVHDSEDEKGLEDTVKSALKQIVDKNYDAELTAIGIDKDRIRHYGFAFKGKTVLIG